MKVFTENTAISLGLAAILAGGIIWLSSMYFETKANGEDIKEIKTNQMRYIEDVERIDARLSRIEGRLGVIETR